jgi:hypothetical protein
MIHRPKASATLLLAMLLSAAMPAAAMQAASPDSRGAVITADTALDTNLLKNAGFNTKPTESSAIPHWTVDGDAHVEKFGTKSFPSKAYGAKYNGGARYLACGPGAGVVRQTVDVSGLKKGQRARVQADFGGTTGHRINISVRATGSENKVAEKAKALDITNHYKVIVANVGLPAGTTQLEVTIQLRPKVGVSTCKIMADSVKLVVSDS